MNVDVIAVQPWRFPAGEFIALAKPRLNVLVVASAAVGYWLGAAAGGDTVVLFSTVVGTALTATGASALNQLLEREVDALMVRTRLRPLADGRLQPIEAGWFATVTITTGLIALVLGANLLAAATALATVLLYIGIYTPLKRRTAFATLVGAVPGALPPMIGWAAARGTLGPEAWVLFLIVFLWQIPHFLSIAWMYRNDYARAGLPLLPVIDPDGRRTARHVLLFAAALVPVAMLPSLNGATRGLYAVAALFLTSGFLLVAIRFVRRRDLNSARWLFVASLVYLPLLWTALLVNRLPAP
ncbi:MAG: protoheme IX farnesyltransferase [Acidobacteria bacterium]|nr:protoheme IX farnesyltransferase [Acidobacteriota bacterium]